jgi:exodeoxyribonuclease VII large subunit
MNDAEVDREVVYTVSELLGGLARLLEERVGRVWVVGEISDVHVARSGHSYFSLQDDAGRLRCALFRSAARGLAFEPEDGLEVLVYGDVSIYGARGDLQIIVRQLEPRGRGALQLAFEQLRRRLEAEGLFDPARKRPLPPLPRRIGVVTSPTGAAIHDILEVTGRRFPAIPLLLAPARVQGEGAEEEIAEALDVLSSRGDVDLILLARGGGSLDDLRPFNTETLARAIVRSTVPVLCGVGHEVDVTIADLAADARAPTPSAAAELAVPDVAVLRGDLARAWDRLQRAAVAAVDRCAARLVRERDALLRAARSHGDRSRSRLTSLGARLDSLSPLAVLARGYALVRRARDGAIVRRAADVSAGERLAIRVAEADLGAVLEAVRVLPDRGKPL